MTGLPTIRDDLGSVAPYESPQLPARYRMNTNESPYPPPDAVVAQIARSFERRTLNRYPDRDATELVEAVARRAGWDPAGVWIANGSNEVLLHLFLAFGGPGRSSLTFEPTYPLHTLIARIAGTTTRSIPRAPDLSIDLDRAVAEVDAGALDIVMICSPNNPDGGCAPHETVSALCAAAPGLVVVDEAYAEFAPPEASAALSVDRPRNLVVVRTFSKAWSLAGVRLGYLLADPELVEAMARVRLPYHLSTPTQTAGLAAIERASEMLETVTEIVRERDRISERLRGMGLRVFPSSANFVLFEVDDPAGVWSELYERGILIRDYSGSAGLQRCLRVTSGLPEENDAFLGAMEEVLGG